MTRSFNSFKQIQGYFEHYNFWNWLTNTFEFIVKENGIKKVEWSLSEGIGTFRVLYDTNFSYPAGTYGLEGAEDLLMVIKQIVKDRQQADPFS